MFAEQPPHVVLLDLILPGLHGIEVLQEIRRTAPRLPVIIVTADSSRECVKRAANLGVSGYLDKPFGMQELKEKIRAALQLNGLFRHSGLSSLAHAAQALVRERFAEKVTPWKLARYLHTSPRQLQRAFKRTSGMTIKTYLARVRINRAVSLLLDGAEETKVIKELSGYKELSHFYKDFRRFTGKTPDEFRRQKALLPPLA